MRNLKTLLLVILFLGLIIIFTSIHIIKEGERGLLLHYDKLTQMPEQRISLLMPGPHFFCSCLHGIKKFDIRLRDVEIHSQRLHIGEQKYVFVDYYLEWQISDLSKYFSKTNDDGKKAQKVLQQAVEDNLEAVLNKLDLEEIVAVQSGDINMRVINAINERASEIGVNVAKIGIIRIDYAPEINDLILQRIHGKYSEIAEKYRVSEVVRADSVKSEADALAKNILAKAGADAAKIRAQGDSEAATIYNAAYQADPKFYLWQKSLDIYKKNFMSGGNILILQMDDAFLKNLQKNNVKLKGQKNG